MIELKSSTKFCHFTTVDNARNILSSERFYLSSYACMNDLAEKKLHEEEEKRVYVLSLCNSEAVNIPVFYLYGGIDGKGCRIQITDSRLRSMIETCRVFYVNNHGKCLKKEVPKDKYAVLYDWVYYIASDGFCYYRDKKIKYDGFDTAINELKKDQLHYFVKNPIWKYEKEFRIVVKLKEDKEYTRIALQFDIKQPERGITVMLGPEVSGCEFSQISGEFSKDYGVSVQRFKSDYGIQMNLVNRNKEILRNGEG